MNDPTHPAGANGILIYTDEALDSYRTPTEADEGGTP